MKSKADWCETVLHRKASEWKYKLKKKKKKKEAASSIKNGLVFFFFDTEYQLFPCYALNL